MVWFCCVACVFVCCCGLNPVRVLFVTVCVLLHGVRFVCDVLR